MYGNQEEIGAALERLFSEGTIKREDMWITSKARSILHSVNAVMRRQLICALGISVHWACQA